MVCSRRDDVTNTLLHATLGLNSLAHMLAWFVGREKFALYFIVI